MQVVYLIFSMSKGQWSQTKIFLAKALQSPLVVRVASLEDADQTNDASPWHRQPTDSILHVIMAESSSRSLESPAEGSA